MTTRRRFVQIVPAALLAAGHGAHAQQPAMVDEKDPQAVGLGYVADASKVDKAKYPKYAPGQFCDNCQLYTAAGNAKSGPCSIFGGKHVAAKGWCSVWVKKA